MATCLPGLLTLVGGAKALFGVLELLGQLLAETRNDFVNFFHFTEKDLLGFYLIRN